MSISITGAKGLADACQRLAALGKSSFVNFLMTVRLQICHIWPSARTVLIWRIFTNLSRSKLHAQLARSTQARPTDNLEITMRAIILVLAATIVAGCASVPSNEWTAKNYDRKYNMISLAKAYPSDFVGTSANSAAPAKAKPGWYKFGHP